MITIKEFSKQTKFSIRMLRYLEELQVLIPARDNNKYRIYSQEQIKTAKKIKRLQNLGIQLKEVEAILNNHADAQIEILEKVLKREQEVAEIKSESIPELKEILHFVKNHNCDLELYFTQKLSTKKKLKTLDEKSKFHRTAYNIPILKNIYEDHLTIDANINLLSTDLMKFQEWFVNCNNEIMVFSILNESSFVFGKNISDKFIDGYQKAWNKFLPAINFCKLPDFSREDVAQLMGPHDIVIRTSFHYKDSNLEAEIVIPYTPIFTMAQLSLKT